MLSSYFSALACSLWTSDSLSLIRCSRPWISAESTDSWPRTSRTSGSSFMAACSSSLSFFISSTPFWSHLRARSSMLLVAPPVMLPLRAMSVPSQAQTFSFSPLWYPSRRASSRESHTSEFSSTWMKALSTLGSNFTTSRASFTVPPIWRSLSLMGLILRVDRGMKVMGKTRCSLRYWMHSLAVLSLSTTTESMWRPSSTDMAMLYLRLVTSASSTMRPWTPGKICFIPAMASLVLRSRSLSRRSARASRSFPSTTCSFLSSCSRCALAERALPARSRRSFFLATRFSCSLVISPFTRSSSCTASVCSEVMLARRSSISLVCFFSPSRFAMSVFWAESRSSLSWVSRKAAWHPLASSRRYSSRSIGPSLMPPIESLEAK
mmetsp:Transcript_38564/g.109054  ORF Transcript_38564/g.109054 Transcript_38564/m.109054 type:complete len:379 (+) Transcript_38564:1197-2333(+)